MVEGLHDDAAAIWTACLESLDGAGSTHKAWLAQIRPVAVAGDTLVLAVPDEFVKEWIEQRYAPTVVTALGQVAGRPLDIRVTVGPLEDSGDEEQLQGIGYFEVTPSIIASTRMFMPATWAGSGWLLLTGRQPSLYSIELSTVLRLAFRRS